ncbi:MAG: DUF3352 domain-containing protein [Actinomycetota bacterium]
MTPDTAAERSSRRRSTLHRRLGALLACCALLLAAAGCSGGDSVFDRAADGSDSIPGGSIPGGSGVSAAGRSSGASAGAIPAGAQVYGAFAVDAIPDLMRLVEAFGASDPAALTEGLDLGEGADAAVEGIADAEDTLTCLGDELLFDPESVPAWMGDEVALALFDVEFDAVTGDVTDPSVLVTVDVDDQGAAGAYLQEIITSLQTCNETTFDETAYQGVTVYRADPGDGEPPIAIALTEGHMLVGMGAGMVERALDLADGVSLADDPDFAEVLAALPADRHLTGYMGMNLPQQMLESLTGTLAESGQVSLPAGLDPAAALAGARGFGLAVTMLTEGIRLDMVAVGEPTDPRPIGDTAASGLPGQLPADAIGFVGIGAFDVSAAWNSLTEMLAQLPVEEGQPSIEDSFSLIGFMLGVDLEEDLIGQLTGEVGIGVLPATAGTLAEQAGVNLGVIAVMGVDDPGAMAGTVAAMADGLAQMMEMPAAPRPFEGGTLYAFSDGTADIVLFGMAGDDMVLTTHESHAVALLAGGPKLAGSARYSEAIGGLPQGSAPMMYLDIAALIAALDLEEAEAAAVAPLQTVAMSVSGGGEVARTTIYARIDY